MKKSSSNQHLRTVVVGSCADEFIRYTTGLLDNYGVEPVICEDIYQAVGWLAKNDCENVFVVGRFEQLSREKGRFFEKVSENGFSCCCLAEGYTVENQKQILAAKGKGVFVINEPAEVEEVVTRLLAGGLAYSPAGGRNKASAFNRNKFVTTKAELDALLGV